MHIQSKKYNIVWSSLVWMSILCCQGGLTKMINTYIMNTRTGGEDDFSLS
jgi:hypothetical protein